MDDQKMNCDNEASRIPYLRAIQRVPGDTPSEKLSWMNRCALQQDGENQIPAELLPLYRVEVALRNKNHEEITAALKSENLTLVNRALKAAWYFDGSYKNVVDDAYFVVHVFPYVPVNTLKRIVNALAYRTINRDPAFAQRMFTAVMTFFDIQTAYPLLLASGEQFAYETIVEKEHALPCRMMKKLWRAYPNFVVRYLKLLPPRTLDSPPENDRLLKPFGATIHKYESFLPNLVKKRVKDFAELCEINQQSLPRITLSNTAAEVFLKKGHSYFVKNPLLYIDMLPHKKISAEVMKTIFPSLLPKKKSNFDTDRMLKYLNYYPKDKRWKLLYKSYETVYDTELVKDKKNITFKLLQVLPANERVKLTRSLIDNDISQERADNNNYEKCLMCYLPTDEVIPALKEKVNYTSDVTDRRNYVLQMFYNCKVNDDNDALYETLDYFLKRHRNGDIRLYEDTMKIIENLFDVSHLNENICSSIIDIARLSYIKYKYIDRQLIEALMHHKLIHDMDIADLVKMYIDNMISHSYSINFNVLRKYPKYERYCLVIFLDYMKTEAFEKSTYDLNSHKKETLLMDMVEAMYNFNNRCEKAKTKIERVTITDYPWLIDEINAILIKKNLNAKNPSYNYHVIKKLLRTKEPKLYDELFSSEKIIVDVTTGEILRLLARSPQSIAKDSQEYFNRCVEQSQSKLSQRFVKATRWYKDIPILFAERCLAILDKKTEKDNPSFIIVMSLLLHGDSLTKVIDPLLPAETTIDPNKPNLHKRYELLQWVCRGMNLSNPPVSLDLLARICRGDYLSVALYSITSVCMRSSIPKVKAFAQNLVSMRISARKHGLAVMSSITSADQQINFLWEMWTTQKQYSIREVLFEHIHKMFVKTPNSETWNFYSEVISTLNNKDVSNLFKPAYEIPQEYINKYLKVWFDTLYKVWDRRGTIDSYLQSLEGPVCDLLSEELVKNVLTRFLFYEGSDTIEDMVIAGRARHFAVIYLSPNDKNKLASRIKITMDVILNAVKNRWNAYLPKSCYYPVNIGMRELIFDLVRHSAIDTQVIDGMLTMFSSVLRPAELAESYLLLTYAKRLKKNCTPQEAHDFGLNLGQGITDIVIFSPLLVPFMADVLDQFLTSSVENWVRNMEKTRQPTEEVCMQLKQQDKPAQSVDEIRFSIIEGLVEANNSYSNFIAITILSQKYKRSEEYTEYQKYEGRYNELIKKFRKTDDPAIMTMLCRYLYK
ncbi:uncharacterized protein LOC109854297 [Pseudomyrmex gracilis]|uniref:uncharacterized protein LOC109854297 n=1 Tax=Pseudomyrmex gracilis TaxID=219809 RepID=UPI000995991D|nr:uncharacterized protein LOC109854297 [Pseudomyrmex gracilis]